MEILIVNKDLLKEPVEIQVSAYANYEFFSVYLLDSIKRKKFIEAIVSTDVKLNYKNGNYFVVVEDGKVIAQFSLWEPFMKRASDIAYILSGAYKAPIASGIKDFLAWLDMENKAGIPCHNLDGENHWYLNSLTVHPDYQGKKIGTKIIKDFIIPYIKSKNANLLYLYTNSTRNLEFYTKIGFEQFDYREFQYNGKTLPNYSLIYQNIF